MPRNVTYHNPINQEENTPLVTILETRVDLKQSTAIDSRKAAYNIDLAKSSFGGISYPEPGSQWYLKKISGVWTLMARAPQQNPQLNPALAPVAGDTYIGSEGTTHVTGSFEAAGGITTTSGFHAVGALSSSEGHTSKVVGDTFKRHTVRDNGLTEWGTGALAADTNLYRSAANVLKTDDKFDAVGGFAISGTNLFDLIYPVGALYLSVVATSPATLFGGTWSALQDSFLVGAGGTYAVNATGGEATHVLITSEMPSHQHIVETNFSTGTTAHGHNSGGNKVADASSVQNGTAADHLTSAVGGGGAHNNLPPYLAVYMWKRVS